MFTSQPQAVEVYERGGWLPASMLGWRHDRDGVCSAWVRVEFAGVVEDAWVELTRLRLPESPARHLALARAPRATPTVPAAAPGADPARTQQLPLVRDSEAPPVGRRVPPAGGRRRAPETGVALTTSTATPTTAVALTTPKAPPTTPGRPTPALPPENDDQGGAVPGRHRAPADEGRHRANDTGMPAAVPAAVPAPSDAQAPSPVRSDLPPAGPVVRGHAMLDLHAEGLTRPMRLDEGVGTVRRSRRSALSV